VVVVRSIISVCIVIALLPWQAATQQKEATAQVANDPGNAIFSGRCGKCHDADGSKKLPDGTTLLARLAKNKDPETRLATRLKNEQERRQVFLYLQPMIERERLSAPGKITRQSTKNNCYATNL
jgi:mono/diheme cytochrome c family protein